MRLGTANTFDNTIANLTKRQADIADLQEKLSAGKRVVRPSDDPVGAAQAERAQNRLSRIETDERALKLQVNAMSMVEATLGDSVAALQTLRSLVINAGNGAYNANDRKSLALEMQGLRDQLFNYANRLDSNGNPIFGGLASQAAPFVDAASGVSFSGIGGQRAATTTSIPGAMDGQTVWMNVPSGNGVFKVDLGVSNGAVSTDAGQVIDPTLVTGNTYELRFSSPTSYDVINTTTNTTVQSNKPYTQGQAVVFDGLSIVVSGKPATGDTVLVSPSTQLNVFKILDDAIASIRNDSGNQLNHNLSLALTQIDASTNRIESARMVAGDLLNRADTIERNQTDKTLQLTADRSRAEDLDMPQAISEFHLQQTGYDSALKTYAAVQRLSLFNFIN
jgi:flagellar hook-associated protein 3 FlgL